MRQAGSVCSNWSSCKLASKQGILSVLLSSILCCKLSVKTCSRTETLSKRRDELQNLLNGLRIGVVSASSEDSRSALEDDSRELARFAKVIDDVPVHVSPQDERLSAATATIARLQPTVARFDTLFLQVSLRVFRAAGCGE